MNTRLAWFVLSGVLVAVAAGTAAAHDKHRRDEVVRARMVGLQEVPAISTEGKGFFRAVVDEEAGTIEYTLSYENLGSAATQAHIHFGQSGVNGGISVFLCSNLGNGPVGTQACPPAPAEISGTLASTDVIGPAGQGIAAGEFAELLEAIREGAAYANVHTVNFPGGEARGQIQSR